MGVRPSFRGAPESLLQNGVDVRLRSYLSNLRRYGPEELMEVAREDEQMSPRDLGKLADAIESYNNRRKKRPVTRYCGCGCGEALPPRYGRGQPRKYLNDTHKLRAHRAQKAKQRAKEQEARAAMLKEKYGKA